MHPTFEKVGLTVESTFIPFSQSRNKDEKHLSLNWRVTLRHNGRHVTSTDYSAGIAHAPAYKLSVKEAGGQNSIMRHEMLKHECETGYTYNRFGKGAPIEPNADNVIGCLLLDCDALDYASFEEWAWAFGYDTDSRNAEAIYNACLKTALHMRAALGDGLLSELREVAREI